jgi:hypothetical protein
MLANGPDKFTWSVVLLNTSSVLAIYISSIRKCAVFASLRLKGKTGNIEYASAPAGHI